jgi:hypothetical protein
MEGLFSFDLCNISFPNFQFVGTSRFASLYVWEECLSFNPPKVWGIDHEFKNTSVGNPWLRHSSHPQEKEGGPKKNEKKTHTCMTSCPWTMWSCPLNVVPCPLTVVSCPRGTKLWPSGLTTYITSCLATTISCPWVTKPWPLLGIQSMRSVAPRLVQRTTWPLTVGRNRLCESKNTKACQARMDEKCAPSSHTPLLLLLRLLQWMDVIVHSILLC